MAPSLIAFMCTGQNNGFSPLCDGGDLLLLATVFFGTLFGVGLYVAKKLGARPWYVRAVAAVFWGFGAAWVASAAFVELAELVMG